MNLKYFNYKMGFPGGSVVKNPPAVQEMEIWSLGREDLLEKEMATHSIILVHGKPHGQKNLAGYGPWGCKESHLSDWTAAHKAASTMSCV